MLYTSILSILLLLNLVPYNFSYVKQPYLIIILSILYSILVLFKKSNFSKLIPKHCPKNFLPIIILIEILSMFSRYLILGFRPAITSISGYLLFKIFPLFIFPLLSIFEIGIHSIQIFVFYLLINKWIS